MDKYEKLLNKLCDLKVRKIPEENGFFCFIRLKEVFKNLTKEEKKRIIDSLKLSGGLK